MARPTVINYVHIIIAPGNKRVKLPLVYIRCIYTSTKRYRCVEMSPNSSIAGYIIAAGRVAGDAAYFYTSISSPSQNIRILYPANICWQPGYRIQAHRINGEMHGSWYATYNRSSIIGGVNSCLYSLVVGKVAV